MEKNRVGGVGGFVHLIANLAGIVAPAVTGFLVEASGGYAAPSVSPARSLCSAPAVAVFVHPPRAEAQTLWPAVSQA